MTPWYHQRTGLPVQVKLQRRGGRGSLEADIGSRQKVGALAQDRGCGLGRDTGSVSRSDHQPQHLGEDRPHPSSNVYLANTWQARHYA